MRSIVFLSRSPDDYPIYLVEGNSYQRLNCNFLNFSESPLADQGRHPVSHRWYRYHIISIMSTTIRNPAMQLVSSIALLVGAAPFQGARGRERSCQDTEPRRMSPPEVGKCNDPSPGPRR